MTDETYNGWTNRETWAVALHINNDQGWQESVLEALREVEYPTAIYEGDEKLLRARTAGEIIRENVEEALDMFRESGMSLAQWGTVQDIGSLWRVNWDELGASFLDDIRDETDREQWSVTEDGEGDEPPTYGDV